MMPSFSNWVNKMPRETVIPPRATVTLGSVEGDITVENGAIVKGEGASPKVNASGIVTCDGNCKFECSLTAEEFEGEGDITVEGDLEVKGNIEVSDGQLNVLGKMNANDVEVDRTLTVEKDLNATHVDVGGSLEVRGNVTAETIDVGGSFMGFGEVKVDSIDVGGAVEIESKVEAKRMDVGGKAIVKGGRIEEVDVGSSFEAEDSLEFTSIDVGGAVRLTGKNVGGDIDVGGSCKVDGDLKFGRIDVGGVTEISGTAEGESLDVGGTVRIGASLRLSGRLDIGGKIEVEGDLFASEIDVGGSVKAKKITAGKVWAGGSIITEDGVQAHYVEIGRRGKVEGPVYADEVLVRERATVSDVNAKSIEMEKQAQARNLYGEKIHIESGCQIFGEVKYTRSLETEKGVKIAKPPEKVEKLP